ncbi:MAG: hypothetical protein ACRC3Y_02880 [Romboutsia sp.]|uniref:hypothetical protein n=1 Tax=Romboutsia sp. TaxID=1965302 RepID=UPI003F2DCA00
MNLKKTFATIIILSIFVTGCNQNKTKEESSIADEATQQRMMTKVQNDVNEIIDKDYEYVLKNMGEPYCTTYYIDMENISTLDKFNETTNLRLIYPKYTAEDELEGSALYIELNDNKVIEVQTYEFSEYDIKTEAVSNNTDIIVDMYNESSYLSLSDIGGIDFNKYEGLEEDKLYEVIGDAETNVEAYDKTRNQHVKAYVLKDKNEEFSKILTVFGNEDNIEKIEVVDKDEIMSLAESYLYKK